MHGIKAVFIVFWMGLASVVLAEGVSVPVTFEYDGIRYKHDAFLKGLSISASADIDGDGREETIVMFPASDEHDFPRAFAFVSGRQYQFRIPTYEYPKKIEAMDIDGDGRREIFLYAYGGVRYTKLFVFKYEDGPGLHKLFENGSHLGIEVSLESEGATIRVGRPVRPEEGWGTASAEPRWEVYRYDGQVFEYKAEASTSPQVPEPREYLGLASKYIASDMRQLEQEPAVRARLGDTLVYRKETLTPDDQGAAQTFSPQTRDMTRVRRDVQREFRPVRKEDFGTAYGFYLKQGLSWEDGAEGLTRGCSRAEGVSCYYVDKMEDVAVPAGVFRDCFKIVVDNIPETDARWYCPGVGVVKSVYRRPASLISVISELEEIRRK